MMEPRDVDTQAGTIRVRFGKRKPRTDMKKPPGPYRVRVVGIDAESMTHIARWMDRRREIGLTTRQPVFATYEANNVGKHLDPRYIRAALARAARKAGIDKRVHPHGLRHSHAFDLADKIPPHLVRDQLGHDSLATTDTYLRHINPTVVIKAVQNRRPTGVSTPPPE